VWKLMRGKREFVARACAAAGITRLLEAMPRQRVLTILNYHRIGNADETPFDSGTFSCTAEQFDWQIEYLKRRYHLTTLEQLLALIDGSTLSEPAVLITFDDGYIDNYRTAFPILRRHDVQGVFFLPTAFVGTGRLPWWDEIAYIVKRSRNMRICLDFPEPMTFDLARDGVDWCIMHILRVYKQPSMQDHNRFVEALEKACESSRPLGDAERCFLSWDEARQMQEAGMAFGSHTHTHEILSKLPSERQHEEVYVSREILQYELRRNIDTLAYPVGAPDAFSENTVETLRQAGYRAAFSFYGGFNRPGTMRPFDIRRCGIDGQSQARLRLQTALGTFTGSGWF
jgi:peptidoglycan/xylan/chitin deacetylase (PgdA/CDA1 family)